MSRAPLLSILLAAAFAACVPAPYEEGMPPPERGAEPESGSEGATVVGRVSPEGVLVADTVARGAPDTARVERETVVTGEIRPLAELETGARVATGEGGTLATGWRVQLFASAVQADAAEVATRARAAIADEVPVYVEWDDPWYKVRAGDHADHAAAERLRERLADLGWREAWVVRTTIRTAP